MKLFSKPIALILVVALLVLMFATTLGGGTLAADSDIKMVQSFDALGLTPNVIRDFLYMRQTDIIPSTDTISYPTLVAGNGGKMLFTRNSSSGPENAAGFSIGNITGYEALAVWVDTSLISTNWVGNKLSIELSQGTVADGAIHATNMYTVKGLNNVWENTEKARFIYTEDTAPLGALSGVPAGTIAYKSTTEKNIEWYNHREFFGLGTDWASRGEGDWVSDTDGTVEAIKFKGWIVIPLASFEPRPIHETEGDPTNFSGPVPPAWNLNNDFYITLAYCADKPIGTDNGDLSGVKWDSVQLLKTVDTAPLHLHTDNPSYSQISFIPSHSTSSAASSKTSSKATSSKATSSKAATSTIAGASSSAESSQVAVGDDVSGTATSMDENSSSSISSSSGAASSSTKSNNGNNGTLIIILVIAGIAVLGCGGFAVYKFVLKK